VQVAADVGDLDERRRLAAKRRLAQLGRAPRDPERPIQGVLVGRVGQRLERGDVVRRSGRPHERRPEALGLGDAQLDGHALDSDAERAPLALLDDRDDLWQLREARERGRRVLSGAHDGEPLAGVAIAPRIAGDLAAQRGGDRVGELPRAREQQRALRLRRVLARQRVEQPRLDLGSDARHVAQPPGGGRRAQLFRGAHAERPRDVHRPPRAQPEVAPEADEAGHELVLELGQLGDVAGFHELAQPRLDPRSDAPQLAHPARLHELGDRDRRGADRLGRAAVRARRVRVGLGELEHGGERLQAIGDRRVVHPGSVPE
jgi:hypothetical protein